MARQRFKHLLPSSESIRRNRYVAFFGSALQHPGLWRLNRRSVAGGVAAGLFCALIPGPLQMIGAALVAVLLRVNLPVAIVCTWYTNPLTIVPLYYLAYRLGLLATGGESYAAATPELDFSLRNIERWLPMLMEWMQAMGKPFAIGLLLLALTLAVTGYVVVLATWRIYVALAWRRRARNREIGAERS
ncbi:MAG TPA: DUF2062 domain-containing protein [Burkholderiales bacterium]|nr:DUF2062 domain-containing protein [Burkholderiales bacterium]